MYFSGQQIKASVDSREIGIFPFDPNCIGADSYLLHLGDTILRQRPTGGVVDLSQVDPEKDFKPTLAKERGYVLEPLRMVVWLTREALIIPEHIAADIDGRSTMAQYGVMPVVGSRHIKPGSQGLQKLEICNFGDNPVLLKPGLAIAKLLFTRLVVPERLAVPN